MTGGGANANRESVDATDTRDPASQVRGGRHRTSDRALDRRGAQHSRAYPRAGCRSAVELATASDTHRPGAGGDALRQRWPPARITLSAATPSGRMSVVIGTNQIQP